MHRWPFEVKIGLSGTHTILNFVQILEIYCCFPEVLIIFVNCHSMMQVSIENILKTKGMLYNVVSL